MSRDIPAVQEHGLPHGLPAFESMPLHIRTLRLRILSEQLRARQYLVAVVVATRARGVSAGHPWSRCEDKSRSIWLRECMYSRAMRPEYTSLKQPMMRLMAMARWDG